MAKNENSLNDSQIKLLMYQNDMLENTKKECVKKGKKEEIQLINQAIQENIEEIISIDPSLKDKIFKQQKINEINDNNDFVLDIGESKVFESMKDEKEIKQQTDDIKEKVETNIVSIDSVDDKKISDKAQQIAKNDNLLFEVRDTKLQYDVIPLPSKGETYKNKISKLSVAFLTAESENMITSPHLYKDDMIIDALLKYHVLNKGFNCDDLISGDVDAIMLWLRATGYGNEYPIIVTDPDSGENFETVVDLSTINIKDITIKGDENGWFDFYLPLSKVNVKFKYLSRKEERNLRIINQLENDESRQALLKQNYVAMKQCLANDDVLSNKDKEQIKKMLDDIYLLWLSQSNNSVKINRTITNRLEMSIMEINGNRDKEYIKNFCHVMPALDSLKLRRYIEENRPGVDWNITVEKPKSLGGGSQTIFLEWGADAFLNVG